MLTLSSSVSSADCSQALADTSVPHRVRIGNRAENTACRMTGSSDQLTTVWRCDFWPDSQFFVLLLQSRVQNTTSTFESRDFHHDHPFLWGTSRPCLDWPLLKIAASTIGHPMPFAGKESARAGILPFSRYQSRRPARRPPTGRWGKREGKWGDACN